MPLHRTARSPSPTLAAAALAAVLGLAAGPADAHGWRGGHRGWGVGIGLSVPLVVVPARPLVAAPAAATEPAAPLRPEPVFRASGSADAARLEADRRACDREAMGNPAAMADARVFHQAAMACMGARGWSPSD